MEAGLRSVLAGGSDRASGVAKEAFTSFAHDFPMKYYWFLTHGYSPHEWQAAFHTAEYNSRLRRFRHLVAGRRGGKTLSAAWETLFYCLHPEQFHKDAHSVDSSKPLWVWVLAKDHEIGRPARIAFQEALNTAGLKNNDDYKWNKTEKTVEFPNGTFLQFKTADDPQSLRGSGLDILWVDEAAFVRSKEAWSVARPALSDKIGLLISTTTPQGKNWFWEEFFRGKALEDPRQFRVEYTSLDNPYFHKEEWIYAMENMHPALFKQEYMASFDAMAGLTLNGEWLQYFTFDKEPDLSTGAEPIPRAADGRVRLHKYIGIDPATGEGEDEFAISLIGITEDRSQGYLLDHFTQDDMPFPDQVDKIQEWVLRHRPMMVGIEANAYQRVLAQQVNRLANFPAVVPVISKGKKSDRIVGMSPLFKVGKIRIRQTDVQFIDQWVSFDADKRDQKDDLLDATEIALGVAGVLLPSMETRSEAVPKTLEDEAAAQIKRMMQGQPLQRKVFDHDLGSEG